MLFMLTLVFYYSFMDIYTLMSVAAVHSKDAIMLLLLLLLLLSIHCLLLLQLSLGFMCWYPVLLCSFMSPF